MLGTHTHWQLVKVVELAMIGEFVMAQTLAHDRQGLQVTRVVHLDVGILAPEERLEDTATPHTDLHAPATEVVEHTDLFDEPYRMVQGQDIDTGPEAQTRGALGDGGQEDVLRWRQAVHRRRMVLRQVIGIKAGLVQPLNLDQPVGVDLFEVKPGTGSIWSNTPNCRAISYLQIDTDKIVIPSQPVGSQSSQRTDQISIVREVATVSSCARTAEAMAVSPLTGK